ncbi:glutamyl-tRNA(Gln) and/or aspartyl-tRNA(Asn) amidotransferase, A subunit [Terriglobus roseus DSM 18391]|uniref:Glutamyl-tRNA(Gln) amidotransferase subunit A n=1 Tax=Terriglobus roseus (strain DSM 18391 / NRRL B-41598 / KBS 63) TaxID=926566 RepID=I3ZCP4_TERRK|nr:Asp-tRNA(Asn)/Glu-tRNA(Gln) amidotransferase subunit GatA [Terriglobus roseus]AFL87012.1 glutamyl-tRNA(Gln) and/or aspartyl-tRNA(Asn) amidotransferase, A subunit [Terriglobus roseus DSM 18391]
MTTEARTIESIRAAILNGSSTATALATAHLAKIRAGDQIAGQEINSFLSLADERALAQAARIDAMAAKGDTLPVLAGVPVGIKDVLAMQGAPATAGSAILKGYHPPYDATSVAKLEAAGAVLLGKLNCDEFAMGSSNENSAYGPVRNPRALDRVPGGSSGGSAAAVAAEFCAASLGTDTGGSVRQPAAFCGVVGLMPTYGRISRYGLIAFASSLDRVGPFTHTVADAATVLGVLAGPDTMDATSAQAPVDDYVAESAKPVEGMRIGIPKEYFAEGLDAEIRAAVEKTIEDLKAQGCTVHPISLPHTQYAVPTYYVLATAEASSNLSRFDGVRFGHRTESPKNLSTMYRESREEGFGAEVKRRILLGTYSLSAGYYDAYYRKAQQVRTLIARDFLAAFEQVDAIVTPMTPTPPWKLGEKTDDPISMYLADIYTVAASLAGICGISVPCGQTQGGLPIGVQLLAGHFQESKLLRVARAVEAAQPAA